MADSKKYIRNIFWHLATGFMARSQNIIRNIFLRSGHEPIARSQNIILKRFLGSAIRSAGWRSDGPIRKTFLKNFSRSGQQPPGQQWPSRLLASSGRLFGPAPPSRQDWPPGQASLAAVEPHVGTCPPRGGQKYLLSAESGGRQPTWANPPRLLLSPLDCEAPTVGGALQSMSFPFMGPLTP